MQRKTKEQQEEEHHQAMQWAVKRRWILTAIYLLLISGSVQQFVVRRSQWHFLLAFPPVSSLPIWGDIATFLLFSHSLIELWLRIHRYRHKLLLTEQTALRD